MGFLKNGQEDIENGLVEFLQDLDQIIHLESWKLGLTSITMDFGS